MVQRYKLGKKNDDKKQENYAAVLPRIISSPRSREAAADYINNANFQEKMAITRMLNEWNKDTFSLEDTTSVIRPEAVPVIKNWMNTADTEHVACAKNLLTHISQEKKRGDEINERNSPRPGTNQSTRPISKQQKRTQWKPSSRPGTTQSMQSSRPSTQQSQKPGTGNGRSTKAQKRPTLRPKTSITYGSFYPSSIEGFGNNTSHFNVVRSQNRPKTMVSKAALYRQKYGDKDATYPEPYNPINRSGIFGVVVYPQPQETVNLDGSLSQRMVVNSRPATQENGMRSRPATQGRIQQRKSEDRLKYSANFQNNNENISPIDTSPAPADGNEVEYQGGNDTYRDLGLNKHWPGRQYQSTQYLLR